MLKILTNIRNAGSPSQTCHFVVGRLITICQFVDFFRLESNTAYFFLKTGHFDTKLFRFKSFRYELKWWNFNHFKYSFSVNKLQSKRLCIQVTVNHFPLSWVKPRANGPITVGQQRPSLLGVTCCICLHILLRVVGSCCAKFQTGQTSKPATPNISFVPWSQKRSERNNVGSNCTALPTLLGPRLRITRDLQSLLGCILPMMHCRSQRCWELLHPFADHCQHGRNNSQQCCEVVVGSCCLRLHVA